MYQYRILLDSVVHVQAHHLQPGNAGWAPEGGKVPRSAAAQGMLCH